jgi:hypothetical protein
MVLEEGYLLKILYFIVIYFAYLFFQQWRDIHFTQVIIRIMAGAKPRTSFKSLFKKSEILPVS